MDYESLWKNLEALMVELTKRGTNIPKEFIDDLKSAKTMINIYKTDPTSLDITTDIELYIGKIEPSLLYLAESDVSKEYADKWLKKINSARTMEKNEQTVTKTKYVSGVSKGEYWIRMKSSGLINEAEMGELLRKLNLSCSMQENDYLLIRGNEEKVKTFVKEVGKRIGKGNK